MPKNLASATKLSKAQAKVMHWLSQGWGARVSDGSAVEINAERVCNVNTMTVLMRLGLVARDSTGYWHATDKGKKMSPNYREPDSED